MKPDEKSREYLWEHEKYQYEIAVATDKGKRKEVNEDALVEDRLPGGTQLAILADGMGGQSNGKLAAGLATTVIRDRLITEITQPPESLSALEDVFRTSFSEANKLIIEKTSGGGATVVATLISGDQVLIASIGDTRCYDIDLLNQRIHQITTDDVPTIEKVMIAHPELDREGATLFLQMFGSPNMVSDNLGNTREELSKPKFTEHTLQSNHVLLLCSDGLHKEVGDEDILSTITGLPNPEKAVDNLIDKANDAGGSDNISAMLVSKKRLFYWQR